MTTPQVCATHASIMLYLVNVLSLCIGSITNNTLVSSAVCLIGLPEQLKMHQQMQTLHLLPSKLVLCHANS